jgi:N-acetylmuramoyl-L-alanine amidase
MFTLLRAFLLLASWAVPALAGVNGLERVPVSGADYVRLGEWAEKNDLTMVWRKKDDPIVVSNPSASLKFTPDSRKAQINGVTVLLSMPVINRSGVPWICMEDIQTVLQPVLFPQKSRARVQTVCLDPGHGGSDKGEIAGGNFEKKYNLLLAQAVEKLLLAEGFKVVLTRTNDVYVKLAERPAIAAKAGADLFVCLHYNSGPPSLRGVEVHCLPPAGMKSSNAGGGRGGDPAYPGNAQDHRNIILAYQVLKAITALPLDDIGVKRDRYKVLREAQMPAILVEGGFMSDPQDAKKIYDADFRQRMARCIVDGIVAYKKAVEEIGPLAGPGGLPVKLPARPLPARGRD